MGADIGDWRDDLLKASVQPGGLFRFGQRPTSISGAKTSMANNFAAFCLTLPPSWTRYSANPGLA